MSTMIQIRNVPEDLHRKLKARASLAGMPLWDYPPAGARRAADRPTPDEIRKRLEGLSSIKFPGGAVEVRRLRGRL